MLRPSLRPLTIALLLLTTCAAWAQFTEAAGKVRDAVVTVSAANRTGTGFIVNSDGSAVTNKHVVGDAKAATIKLRNGEQVPATVVKASADRDLCLLKLDRQHLPAVQFASSDKLKQGQDVAAVGAPFGLSGSLTKGVVSATDRDIDGRKFLQIDAALNQGNSGGPIINADGLVVGIATKVAKEAQNVGFAIPSAEVMAFLDTNKVAFETALADAPKAGATEPAPAQPAAEPGAESAPPPAPPATLPAQPASPPPSPLAKPTTLLILAACVAFVVALITALLVAGRKPAPIVPPQPVQYTYAPPLQQTPAARPAPPAQPAPPPVDDLSDIDIELR